MLESDLGDAGVFQGFDPGATHAGLSRQFDLRPTLGFAGTLDEFANFKKVHMLPRILGKSPYYQFIALYRRLATSAMPCIRGNSTPNCLTNKALLLSSGSAQGSQASWRGCTPALPHLSFGPRRDCLRLD